MKYTFEKTITCERVPVAIKSVYEFLRELYGKIKVEVIPISENDNPPLLVSIKEEDEEGYLRIFSLISKADLYRIRRIPVKDGEIYQFIFSKEDGLPGYERTVMAFTIFISVRLNPSFWLLYGFDETTSIVFPTKTFIDFKTSDIGLIQVFDRFLGIYAQPWPGQKKREYWEEMM